MRRTLSIIGVIILSSFRVVQGQSSSQTDVIPIVSLPSYATLYEEMTEAELDPSKSATVSNLTIQRDVASFTMKSGEIHLLKPVAGKVRGAFFFGEGSFSFTPPTTIEREQLRRFYEKTSLEEPVKMIFLLFADSTFEELKRSLAFTSRGKVPAEYQSEVGRGLKYLVDESHNYLDDAVAHAFLDDDGSDFFYAQVALNSGDPMFFQINPYVLSYEDEEVSLMRKGEIVAGIPYREPVSSFHRQGKRPGKGEPRERIKIERCVVDCSIDNSLDLAASATVSFKPVRNDLRWIDLYIDPSLKVDSIRWENGLPSIFHQNGAGTVWLRNNASPGEDLAAFTMYYSGRFFYRADDYILPRSSVGWYPAHDPLNRAHFDLTFHVPNSFRFASIGKLQSSGESDGIVTTRWVTDRPIRNASFALGVYKEQTFTSDSIAPLTVYRSLESSGGVSEQVAWDVQNSIKFYEYLYGRLPVEHFHASEIPASHGEAFPGLIHLSAWTFDRNDGSGRHEIFRAHEVAHQWWGIGLDFKTYHDQWLSEAFAEYSGLMFMQAVLKDNEKFFRRLEDYRKDLVGKRSSIFGKGMEMGPIWLGQRNNTSSTQNDYFDVIYKKGAWVLHMLRNLLLDLNTMKEDKFRMMMRDFYGSYQGGNAGTEDFMKIVEKHAGMRMDWFFDAWVYGSGIPKYSYAYKVEEAGGGKYRVSLKVDQTNVPDDFVMQVPVKIDFGDGKFTRVRVWVRGSRSEPQLPLMPLKPKEVIFNDLQSVLCEVEEADWE